ncbi:uncharacterized protein BDZ99DRAFT_382906, partial [Mytilinidion resinicola]
YLSNGAYSDLEIRCRDTSYAVHRIVLCSQVKFLENACNGAFKVCLEPVPNREAKDRIVDLSYDDPTAVRSMIQFAYTNDYSLDDDQSGKHALQHVDVYASAKYDIPSLGNLAKIKFKPILEKHWDADWVRDAVHGVYHSTYSSDRGLRDILVQAHRRRETLPHRRHG